MLVSILVPYSRRLFVVITTACELAVIGGIVGTLGETVGYHAGFAAAGFGMLIGLTVFILGLKHLPPDGSDQEPAVHDDAVTSRDGSSSNLSPEERKRVAAILIVSCFCIVFWGVYEQQGNTVQLFAVDHSDMLLVPAPYL